MAEVSEVSEAMGRITVSIREVVEALHKITGAASLTAAQMEAFLLLVKLGEVTEDERA